MISLARSKMCHAILGIKGNVRWEQPLAKYTSWHLGGCADCMIMPHNLEALSSLIKRLNETDVPWLMLGTGTNVLFSDAGFRGAIIRLGSNFTSYKIQESSLIAEASVPLKRVVQQSTSCGLSGMESLIGIPGSVGGAVWGNAGAHGVNTLDHAICLEGVSADGTQFTTRQFRSAYRESPLPARHIITKAYFSLSESDPDTLTRRVQEYAAQRKSSQPIGQATAGCVFKNPREFSAGKLIDESELKGFRIGGAVISTIHANFLVNEGAATAADMLALIRHIQQTVLDRYSILLTTEVQILDEFGNHIEVLP